MKKIIAGFQKTYPDAHCELDHRSPLQLLVATILSAQCTDKRVNIVTPDLFKKYRTATGFRGRAARRNWSRPSSPPAFSAARRRTSRTAAASSSSATAAKCRARWRNCIQLDGVGRKTANVVLGNAFGVVVGVIVDTHAMRLSHRLGLTTEKTPEKIELALMKLLPQKYWLLFSHWLVWHGRRRCFARKPDCGNCEVGNFARESE